MLQPQKRMEKRRDYEETTTRTELEELHWMILVLGNCVFVNTIGQSKKKNKQNQPKTPKPEILYWCFNQEV